MDVLTDFFDMLVYLETVPKKVEQIGFIPRHCSAEHLS